MIGPIARQRLLTPEDAPQVQSLYIAAEEDVTVDPDVAIELIRVAVAKRLEGQREALNNKEALFSDDHLEQCADGGVQGFWMILKCKPQGSRSVVLKTAGKALLAHVDPSGRFCDAVGGKVVLGVQDLVSRAKEVQGASDFVTGKFASGMTNELRAAYRAGVNDVVRKPEHAHLRFSTWASQMYVGGYGYVGPGYDQTSGSTFLWRDADDLFRAMGLEDREPGLGSRYLKKEFNWCNGSKFGFCFGDAGLLSFVESSDPDFAR
jgi:hypothetical protein